jgi:hypothetical protein
MNLKTSGKPSKISLKTCKDAIHFYGRMLLSEKMYNKVSVKVVFEVIPKTVWGIAFCEWVDDNHRPKQFIITVSEKLDRKQTLLALAHEMVHVKQYANGELKDYVKVDRVKWKNTIINTNEMNYYDYPYEIEALGREIGLYVRFAEKWRKENGKTSTPRLRPR